MCRISAFLPATINSLPRFFSRNRVRIFPKEQLPFILQNNLLLCVVNGELHVKMTSILSLPCLSFPSAVSLYPQTTFLLASCPCQTKSNSAFFSLFHVLVFTATPQVQLNDLAVEREQRQQEWNGERKKEGGGGMPVMQIPDFFNTFQSSLLKYAFLFLLLSLSLSVHSFADLPLQTTHSI